MDRPIASRIGREGQKLAGEPERRLQPVRGGDGEIEIHSFMREAFVFRIHPELRVGHLDEGLRGQGSRETPGPAEDVG